MNHINPTQSMDSGMRSVEQIGFDMLRAIISARQAGSATVRALSGAHASADPQQVPTGSSGSTMALLTSRSARSGPLMGGAFANHCAGDHPFGQQGESHG